VFPDNPGQGLPSVQANVLLNDGRTGTPLALVAGQPLTNKRTAAASALAADHLARADAHRLLMVGTGAMAPEMVRAHCAVRPIDTVRVWGRTPAKAAALAETLRGEGLDAQPIEELQDGVAWADTISCATMSTEPLVRGDWLRPGQHLDLMGAFKPSMRETDDRAVQVAQVFCDTFAGCLKEGGDLVQPIESGALAREAVLADLFGLCRGDHLGRQSADAITLFKSTGAALEDLAAAILAYERSGD
jgi:ornithine cyclodeaminase